MIKTTEAIYKVIRIYSHQSQCIKRKLFLYGELDSPVGILSPEAPEVPLMLPLEGLKSEKKLTNSLKRGLNKDVGDFCNAVPF